MLIKQKLRVVVTAALFKLTSHLELYEPLPSSGC